MQCKFIIRFIYVVLIAHMCQSSRCLSANFTFNGGLRNGNELLCTNTQETLHTLDAYWINLEANKDRKDFMETQLTKLKLSHERIGAITPNSSEYKLELLEKPCKRNTPKDLAVIMSHLKAMHTAVHNPISVDSPLSDYALILEDDVKFLYDIDFVQLVASAPPGFGILQLVTSNVEAINSLYSQYTNANADDGLKHDTKHINSNKHWRLTAWNHLTKNGKTSLYWSAQAYIVNKRVVRPFLDDVTTFNKDAKSLSFRLVNSFFPGKCVRSRAHPCILSNCLFADSYIFAGGGPTYVSTLPLFGGSRVGVTSTLHQEQVGAHQEAFALIRSITADLRHPKSSRRNNDSAAFPSTLPSFLKLPVCVGRPSVK